MADINVNSPNLTARVVPTGGGVTPAAVPEAPIQTGGLSRDAAAVNGRDRLATLAGGGALEVPPAPDMQAILITQQFDPEWVKGAMPAKKMESILVAEPEKGKVVDPPKFEEVVVEPPKPLVSGNTFRSWGDPHEVSGDGLKFDNMLTGTFVAFRSKSGDLELQKYQEKDEAGRWAGATLNKAAGIKVGDNTISYDIRGDQLAINGKNVPVKPGATYDLPGGGSVSVSKDGQNINVNTPQGDRITIEKKDGYIDFNGEISPKRESGSVFGSLGTFDADNDAGNDLRLPDGSLFEFTWDPKKTGVNNVTSSQAHIDKFLETWRVPTHNDLIPTR